MKYLIVITLMMSVYALSWCQYDTEKQIQQSVLYQMENYPESTLQDLYKNFFQDWFGPGHLITDTISARNYLSRELTSFEYLENTAYYEPTGHKGNFYRVNLSVIQKGVISEDILLNALIRSSKPVASNSIDAWKKEWGLIDSVIQSMNLHLPDYERDRESIFSLIQQGKYVAHHSRRFSHAYDPHYRIIEKHIFEKELLPLLQQEDVK